MPMKLMKPSSYLPLPSKHTALLLKKIHVSNPPPSSKAPPRFSFFYPPSLCLPQQVTLASLCPLQPPKDSSFSLLSLPAVLGWIKKAEKKNRKRRIEKKRIKIKTSQCPQLRGSTTCHLNFCLFKLYILHQCDFGFVIYALNFIVLIYILYNENFHYLFYFSF